LSLILLPLLALPLESPQFKELPGSVRLLPSAQWRAKTLSPHWCCLHALNSTGYFSSTSVFDVHLWNECGITLPQSCDATRLKIIVIFMILLQILA